MRFSRWTWCAAALLTLSLGGNSGSVASVAAEEAPNEEGQEATPTSYTPPANSEKFAFEAEVHRMLDIVVNSLYQNKDVFLRELISNASDALDKLRFLALTKPELLNDQPDLEIRIQYDADEHTLTISDSGIGMKHDELVENLGTVARSGTTKFLEVMKGSGSQDNMGNMIGQFGVGFYSTFLVADRVTVASKHPESDTQHVWESANGSSEFVIYPDPRGNSLKRGTEITLHLKEDSREYESVSRLKNLITHYSEFVVHPIHLRSTKTEMVEIEEDEEKKEEDTTTEDDELDVGEDEEAEEPKKKFEEVTTHEWEEINNNPAIWARSKEDVSDEEYQEFWKVLSKESYNNATRWTHFDAEGKINFRSILYLPEELPQSYQYGNIEPVAGGLKLYVRKVLISDSFDLMPRYLGFIRGVVDSEDLPLNVNRETLQESKIIQIIKKKLVRKAIEMIRDFSKAEAVEEEEVEAEIDADGNVIDEEPVEKESPYLNWYKKFSPSLKMGVIDDEPNRGRLMKLLRFQTSKSDGKWISLEDYVGKMKEWQTDIYVLAGMSMEELQKSKFLERFVEKDVEVVFLTDPIDEYLLQQVKDFDGKKFSAISSENVKLKDEDEDLAKRRDKFYTKQFKPLTKWLKKLFGASVMRVTVSKRLGSTPAIVSSSEYGQSANMERIMQAQALQHGSSDFMMRSMKVFEINPRHPLIHKLLEGCPPDDKEEDDAKPFIVAKEVEDAAWMLHDLAMMNGGFPVTDVEAHTRRMTNFLQSSLALDALDLLPEVDPPEEEEEAPEMDLDGLDGMNMADFDMTDFDLDSMDM